MKQLEPHHDSVGRFYDQVDEAVRLEAEDPIEYAITQRYLQRYIPDNVTVADVGVGGGQYSELLARRGCRLHLALDLVERTGTTAEGLGVTSHYLYIGRVVKQCAE